MLALLALTTLRLTIAATLPLAPDEAYYWVWSKALAPGYLDHPPMVALFVRAGTILAGDTPLGVRLLAPLAAAAGSLMLADAARTLWGRGAGLAAAALLNATLMIGAGSVLMTPDTPLLLFWTATLWALARLAAGGHGMWWLLAGAAAGAAFESKYTALLLAVAAAGWLLGPARPWLRTPWPWLGAAAGLLLAAPVILWNASHGWVSFARQGGRVADWAPARAATFLLELAAGQLGLATPWIAVLFALAAGTALRRLRHPGWALCAALIWPGALVFLQHALGGRVQANWVAILYPGGALAAAALCHGRRLIAPTTLGAALTFLVYAQAIWAPLPLPPGLDPATRLAGWPQLAQTAATHAATPNGIAPPATFLAAEDYATASALAWAAPALPVLAVDPRWTTFNLPTATPTTAGLVLVSARRQAPPDPSLWTDITLLATLPRSRAGMEAETFRLYRARLRPGAPAVLLPTRNP